MKKEVFILIFSISLVSLESFADTSPKPGRWKSVTHSAFIVDGHDFGEEARKANEKILATMTPAERAEYKKDTGENDPDVEADFECITPQFAQMLAALTPEQLLQKHTASLSSFSKGEKCDFSDKKISAGIMSYQFACSANDGSQMKGTYSGAWSEKKFHDEFKVAGVTVVPGAGDKKVPFSSSSVTDEQWVADKCQPEDEVRKFSGDNES